MKNSRMCICILGAVLSLSCTGLDNDDPSSAMAEEVPHDMIVLGGQLDDPYSLENVEAALTELYPTKAGRVVLSATDIYVRFLPETENDYNRLVSMGLNLLDHPMDYEIIKEGDYYHDPSLDENAITWQYAVVKPDFVFPDGIVHEVLDECFIADNSSATRANDGIDWVEVEREAYRLTGNASALSPAVKGEWEPGHPTGRITIVDDRDGSSGPVGVAGVKVSCNTFVKFSSAYTDSEGYYEMDKSFSSELRYRIVFQNQEGFAIGLNKVLVPASSSTLGKGTSEGVSIEVSKDSDRRLFARCAVNNSAVEYFERCKEEGKEIDTPPANTRFWLFQSFDSSCSLMLQQGTAVDGTMVEKFLGDYASLVKMFLPDIILGLGGLEEYSSIYAQTVHELAHASHFMKAGKQYWNKYAIYMVQSFISSGGRMYGTGSETDAGYCEVGEMWAFYLQNRLYKERYGEDRTTFGTSFWFRPQILLYIDERGLGRSQIFDVLEEDVCSRKILHTRLADMYPDFSTVIDQAFERY
ncbi:MAG: hypothetical protein Q4G10_05570 [Bacteroidia bacterium]|nr:hypothetical protein [Bacteroidia bacterium]